MASQSPDPRGKMSMTESMSKLCLSDKFADVTFVFGSEKLSAHRVVLSMRSPVFEAMLYGPLSETPGCKIRIEDMDLETFELFLWFIYTDYISLDGRSVLKIFYLANKYNLDILEDKCSDFLKTSIDVDNVCVIYEHAGTFGQDELRRSCFEFITDHGAQVICSHNFLVISKDTLAEILSSDDLSIDERLIFDAAIRWAKQQCRKSKVSENAKNIRHHLGDVLYSIRFPLFSMDVFAKEICPSQVLSTKEENTLFRFIATASDTSKQERQMVGQFLMKDRKNKFVIVNLDVGEIETEPVLGLGRRQKSRYHCKSKNTATISINAFKTTNIHSIKCSDACTVSDIQRITLNGKALHIENEESTPDNLNIYDEAKCVDVGIKGRYMDNLKASFDAKENKIVFCPPTAVEGETYIVITLNNCCDYRCSEKVTVCKKSGLDIEIVTQQNLFDHIVFSP